MIRALLLLLPLLLAACATPSPQYLGVPARSVVLDGREYRVFLRRSGATGHAQVVRIGWAPRRDHAAILEAMVLAAEQVSGCTAARAGITGDSGVMNMVLRC